MTLTLSPDRLAQNFFLVVLLLIGATGNCLGQAAARPNRGVMPTGSYAISDIENINVTNGNLNLAIPLASLPPMAGGKLGFTVRAEYNSKGWDTARDELQSDPLNPSSRYVVTHLQQSGVSGWRVGGTYEISFEDITWDYNWLAPAPNDPEYNLLTQNRWSKVMLTTPDGATHELRPLDYSAYADGFLQHNYLRGYYKDDPNTANTTLRYYSYDGSHLWAKIDPSPYLYSGAAPSWIIYLPDGTRIEQASGIQRIIDTNGNKIKIWTEQTSSTVTITHYQDELTAREVQYVYDSAANSSQGLGQVKYQTVTGTWMTITINFGTTHVFGKTHAMNDPDCGDSSTEINTSAPVVRSIVFPQTEPTQPPRQLEFSYNSDIADTVNVQWRPNCSASYQTTTSAAHGWGSLSRVVLTSGAIVDYSYSLDGQTYAAFDPDDAPRENLVAKTVTHDGISETWNYTLSQAGTSSVSSPDDSFISETRYPSDPAFAHSNAGFGGKEGLVYRTNSSNNTLVERHWSLLIFSGANNIAPGANVLVSFNPVVDAEYTTLLDDTLAHNPVKMSAKTFQYDYNGNLLTQTDYDWFDPSLVLHRDAQGIPTEVPQGLIPLRVTNNTYYNAAPSSTSANVYAKRSISTGAPLILNAPQQTTVGSSIEQFSYDTQTYGLAPTIGNLTTKKIWDDLDSKWITTSNTYDVYGNVATTTDGRGKITTFTYGDSTHALPTSVTVDPQNGTGTQTSYTAYDTSTGLIINQTDVNGQLSSINYINQLLGTVDPFGRPGYTEAPQVNINGTNHKRRVTTTYKDSARQVIVEADLNAQNDKLLKTQTTTDMLGRPILSEQTEDATHTISITSAYLNMGRVTLTSSAMRGTDTTTDSWTRVTKDAAGRVKEVATFGGRTQPAWTETAGVFTGAVTTVYDANYTTVTDQAGKVRRSMVDALGRLIRVDEPDSSGNLGTTASPTQPTSYGYDVLGNLTTVTQGLQTRNFTYDSLSRLRTAINPESGTVSYQYDDNGNLLVKTDARGVSTHFDYDSINRLIRRWYNGSSSTSSTTNNSPALPSGVGATDEARFYYDSQPLPSGAPTYTHGSTVGRMVAQIYGSGSNGDYYAYDVLGRATLKIQQTGSVNYQLSASYTLSGAISALTYPSGHTINDSFDQIGRLSSFSGNLGDGNTRTYATGISYSPIGGLVTEQFGTNTPVYNKLFYNSRGQLAEIRESTTSSSDTSWNRGAIINHYSDQCWGMCSGSSMTDNNGNLQKQEVYIPNDDQISGYTQRWQQYDYDSLNRLNWAREIKDGTEQWKQQFTYDRWGNRTINTGVTYGVGINNQAFTVNTSNNRLGVPSGQSGTMSYDAAGNLTNDTYTGAGNRTYDGENKITSAWGGNNQAQLYAYDTSGQRIKRTVNGVETWQIYGFGGELLAEYPANGVAATPQKEYGYRNGQLLITAVPNSPSAPPSSGLVGYWKFDENTGTTATDSSGNNNTGTLSAGTTWATGQSNAATSLDGVDDYVQVGAQSSLAMTSAATFSAWIYPTGPGSHAFIGGIIFNKEGEYEIARFPDGTIQSAFANTNPGWSWINSGYVAPLNQWTHVAVTYDNGVVKTYINGTLTNTYSGSGTIGDTDNTQNDFRIGGRQGLSQNFQGRIDEARVYNRVLSATEAATLPVSTPSGLVGYWKFDENSGTTTADSSGNNNTGTLSAGATWATGQSSAATSLDGVDDYVQVGSQSSLAMTSAATFSAWIYPTGPGSHPSVGGIIFNKEGEYEIARFPDGTIQSAFANTNPGWNWINSGYVAPLNQWTHVAVTYDNGVVKTYINGTLTNTYSGSGTIGDAVTTQNDFRIGGRQGLSQNFQGRIDEARVYNRVLSATEAATLPSGASSGGAQINWLVTDQLGTPRMVFDQTGALNNVKRHDYLPFGEELFAPTSGRTTAQGYSIGEGLRQQFTQKERDIETGLDYFGARYYASAQGRFSSIDPKPVTKESFLNPQRWNLYVYVKNNPLGAIDPDGADGEGKTGDKVISVFLDVSLKDLGRSVTKDKVTKKVMSDVPSTSDWQRTAAGAPAGYRVELFGSPAVTGEKGLPQPVTDAAFNNALKNSDVVIYVGHGRGDPGTVPFVQQGIQAGNTYYTPTGTTGAIQTAVVPEGTQVSATGPKPETNAAVVMNLSCNANRNDGSYFNFTGKNQVMVTLNSNWDGVTTADAIDKAANAFVKTYMNSGGDVQKSVDAANQVLQSLPGEKKQNVGDQIEPKKVN